ncbi:MAG TPA: metalloregulator ArsR/SmtB family transcription factor [Polyangiales bacterium]|nr:metalloregulator ArsR/SmtB family transcription factor [Polyangiales bacterium]
MSPKPRRTAASKAERELAELEAIFAALAHASRRHVLLVLRFRGGEMTAGEIAQRFACSWPTTSRHLRILEAAGLVQVEKRGRERVYRLDQARLLRVTSDWLKTFSEQMG